MFSILCDNEAIKKLGERVRAERLRRNFTQAYVASIIDVSLPTYRKIEDGEGSVEFRHVAKALGVLGYATALGELVMGWGGPQAARPAGAQPPAPVARSRA
jgi:transcriptional regulator with XRE-family HTH domain